MTAEQKDQLERFVGRIIAAAKVLDDADGLNAVPIIDIVESARALQDMLVGIHTSP